MTGTDLALAPGLLGTGRGRHAFEDTVERLATAIRLGVFADGSTLPPERELAATLGVSRATLREAIAALRTAGMVQTVRGRGGGTVVDHRPTTPGAAGPGILDGRRDELLDSLTFRRVVEPGAAQLAAETTARRETSADERRRLQELLAEVSAATDPAEHRQADSRLHLAIASLTGSPQLLDAVTRVQADLHLLLSAIPVLPTNIEHSGRQHREIVAAVLRGDGARARRTMEHHCDDTAALLRGLLH
ncbi:GntR family transcriptional repressor for pyruvate dehydrogenase complex [Friedmanniella endophytica]|uniref:GntR family transcriptional repressor for pyruvate dehydrogenase complex n=1 Tax=Microlunatus kandeliicorticis TaxID=1759536 RepID=A0A7W3P4X1_9ACTN|nr:FCD domain-containing protein [Microlunatus kandeliicorticis]MBA8793351.1 GntR family transcriptional repressor for pyruvate dehydrogenase complex [Microlunatus kandeliicorticis]